MEAMKHVMPAGSRSVYNRDAVGQRTTQLPKIHRQLPRESQDRTALRYLKYLRKVDDRKAGVKPCLPPLTIRNAQGKYREPPPPPPQPCLEPVKSVSGDAACGARSVSHPPRRDEAPTWTKASALHDTGAYNFPRPFWEGPVFKIYKNCPKLRSSMTLRRLRALKSLLSVHDFETKTGFDEAEYDTGDGSLVDMTSSARKRREASRPPSKMSSEHSHRRSVLANRLPTIDDE